MAKVYRKILVLRLDVLVTETYFTFAPVYIRQTFLIEIYKPQSQTSFPNILTLPLTLPLCSVLLMLPHASALILEDFVSSKFLHLLPGALKFLWRGLSSARYVNHIVFLVGIVAIISAYLLIMHFN